MNTSASNRRNSALLYPPPRHLVRFSRLITALFLVTLFFPTLASAQRSLSSDDFVLKITTTAGTHSRDQGFTFYTQDTNYEVDWDNNGFFEQTVTSGNITHRFPTAGVHTIRFRNLTDIYINRSPGKEKYTAIEQWGTGVWDADMKSAFSGALNLTGNYTDTPTMSAVTNMGSMFFGARSFNGDMSDWNTASVTNMSHMFSGAITFNRDISRWNTGSVTFMIHMFDSATSFNRNVSRWNVEAVTHMSAMFQGATLSPTNYDALLIGWNAQNLQKRVRFDGGNSRYSSDEAQAARANMMATIASGGDGWDIVDDGRVVNQAPTIYDATFWVAENAVNGAEVGTVTATDPNQTSPNNTLRYSITAGNTGNVFEIDQTTGAITVAGTLNREITSSYSLIVQATDGGTPARSDTANITVLVLSSDDFVLKITTTAGTNSDDKTFTFYTQDTNYEIDWDNDGAFEETDANGTVMHLFPTAGVHTIRFRNLTDIHINGSPGKEKYTAIEQWGTGVWDADMARAFNGANNLTASYTDTPDMSAVTNMNAMFREATFFNGDISRWNTASVTDMENMFNRARSFNRDISRWNTASVMDMSTMFFNATSFNGDISRWNTASVTDMGNMFNRARSFNGDISRWNVEAVTYMIGMFFDVTLSSIHYDALLIGWNAQNLQKRVRFDGGNSRYSSDEAQAARDNMMASDRWFIADGGRVFPNQEPTINDTTFRVVENAINGAEVGTVIATDPNQTSPNNALRYSITAGNTGNVFAIHSTRGVITLAGTLNRETTSSYSLTVTATDGGTPALSDTATITIVVTVPITVNVLSPDDFVLKITTTAGTHSRDQGFTFYTQDTNYEVDWDNNGFFEQTVTSGNITHRFPTAGVHTIRFRNLTDIYINRSPGKEKYTAIEQWGTGVWDADMKSAFSGALNLTGNYTDTPTMSAVTNMGSMFFGARSFNGDMSDWNTASVTNMSHMFSGAITFNRDISRWNTGSVTFMIHMFDSATSFNRNVSRWNVEAVTHMSAMFQGATLSPTNYDALLIGWNAQNLQKRVRFDGGNSRYSSDEAQAARANMMATIASGGDGWDIVDDGRVVNQAPTIYDATFWVAENAVNGAEVGTVTATDPNQTSPNNTLRYSITAGNTGNVFEIDQTTGAITVAGTLNREITSSYSLIVQATDGGTPARSDTANITVLVLSSDDFVLKITTTAGTNSDDKTFTFYTQDTNYEIDWDNDGAFEETDANGTVMHLFPTAGVHTIRFRNLTDIHINGSPGKEKYTAIEQWGTGVWDADMARAFNGANNLTASYTDTPDMSAVTNMNAMFREATFFNGDISRWNTAAVIDMSYMFSFALYFNGDISGWNVEAVTDMRDMFFDALAFNRDLSRWNVESVTDMNSMFRGATSFNRDLSSWNVESVTDMNSMFRGATSFNRDLSSWNVESVTDMNSMFRGATSFNRDISGWDVSGVHQMTDMFLKADSFRQNLGAWYITPDRFTIDESSSAGSIVGEISAQNFILNGQNPTYAITGADAVAFTLIGNSLAINNAPSLSKPSYTITITSTGDFGTSNSRPLVINVVDTTAPDVPIITTRVIATNQNTITIEGTAEGNSTVTLLRSEGSFTPVTTTATVSETWSIQTVQLTEGSNTFTVTARDTSDNTSGDSDSVVIILDITPPVIDVGLTTIRLQLGSPELNNLLEGVTATDNFDDDSSLTSRIMAMPTTLNNVSAGRHTITYSIEDVAGNRATQQTRIYTINETGTVTITGTATEKATLTASVTDANGLSGVDIAYQWQADGGDISGATTSTYLLTQAEVGKRITVTARYTDEDNFIETVTSVATSAVANVNDDPVGLPTITGTPTQGQTLTADVSGITDVDGLGTFSYQWQADGTDISGETGSTFTLTQSQVGQTITVTVRYNDNGGTDESVTSDATSAVANINDAPVGLPTITGTPTTTVAEDTAYSFTPSGADVDVGTTLTYSINTQPSWANFDTATGTLSGTPDNGDVGTTTGIVITVSDGSLMASLLSFDLTVTNANDAPTISGTPTTTVAEDTAYSFTPIGADVDVGTTLTYSINTQPSWASFDTATGTLSGTPDNGDVGTTTGIVITISDGSLMASLLSFDLEVTNVNDRPTITGTPTTTVAEDTAYSFTPIGADVDVGTTLTYSINTQPSWANFDTTTGTLSGTPDNGDVGITTGIVITVSDGTASTDLATFSITVTNTNDAPTISGTPTTTVAEDTAYSFTPSGADVDVGTTLTYSINTQPSWANFDTTTGTLSGTPDNGDVGITTGIVITVSDGTASTDLATFSITVTNTNDAPTISGTPTTTVAEDTAYSFTPSGADVDVGTTLTYSINTQPSWANFDTATGTLSGTPDNGDVGITTGIVITVSDGTASTDLATFSITVTNTNDAPTISGTPTTTVAEDTAYSFTPSGADVDVGTTLTYSINTQPSWANFDTATGTLSGTPDNGDVGITTGIVITVSDGTASTDLATFSITVTNTNDAPTISGTPTTTVAEDTAYSFTPSGADVDVGTTLTYSINTQPSWANFDTTTGTLSGTPDNGDVGITTGIVITVSDGTASTDLATFSITVTNTNDSPTITGTPTTSIAEDTAYSFTPSGGDIDVGTTLTYSINTQPSWANFDTATGTLSGTPDNGDVGTTNGIVITVSDGTASTDLAIFSITVTNTNDAPTISGTPTTSIAEDTAYSFTSIGADVDASDTLVYSITSQPSWANFDTATGTLSGTPDNGDVGTTTGIVITVSDGTASTDLAIFSITVTNTNDAPTVSGTPTTTVAEDTAYSFTPSGGDVDVGTTLTYSINTQPSWANFDTATGTLSGTPDNGDVGTTTGIVITVSDGSLMASLLSFDLTVTNVNDSPTITGTPTTSIAEDTAYSFTPSGGDIDVGTTLTYSINTQPSWANFDTATGTLSGTPDNGDVGTTNGIVITVSDGTASTDLAIFSITVTNTNDAPTISGTPTTTVAEDTAYSFTPIGADVDASDTLVYSITSQPSWANFDTATGTLSGTPDNGDVGTTTGIVITVSDGTASTDLAIFSITVTNTNDSPTITGTPTTSIAEDTAYSFTPSGGDMDVGTTLTYSINTQPSWANFDTATGTLSGTPDNGDVGTTTGIMITVSDGTASTDLATFSITVTNTNDAPTISGTPTTTVAEDTAYSFTPSGGDVDVGTTLTYSINTQPSWANFDTATGTLSGTPDNGDVGTTTGIVITVSDGSLMASLLSFNLTVTNVNDAPTVTGTPTTTVAEDTTYSFTPSGGDVDVGTTLTYSINTQPSWANFDTATGTLRGTPDNGDVGTTTGIMITVSDGTESTDLATFSITVTNTNDAPTISGTPTTTVAEDTAYSFTPIGADVDASDTLVYSITSQPSWANFDTATGTLSGTPDNGDVGTTNGIVIAVSDGTASTDLAIFSITVTNTNDRPTITGTPTTSIAEDTAYSFTPSGGDIDVGTTLTYSINTQPSWANFDTATGTLSGTPDNGDVGTTNGIVITVSDGTASTDLAIFSITVTNTNDAPTISGTPTTTVAEDTAYSFTSIGADVDASDTLVYSITSQPSWANFDTATGTLSGTPDNGDVGTTTGIVITVSDGTASTDLAIFSITVTNTNDAPTISGTPTTTVAEDTAYSFTPSGGDIDVGTTLTYSINTQPSWAIFDTATGTLSGTPDNGDVGTTNGIVITVSDGTASTDLATFSITVTNTNDRPTITGTPTTSIAEDTAYSFTPSGGDVDVGTTLTYSINTQPSWANFDTATGTLSGTPDNGDVGTTTGIVITVSDGTASTDLATFSITVTNTNDAPTITGTPTTTVAEDTAYSFTPSGGDMDVGTTLTYSINTQPSWANFDTATGTLSGTPDNGDVGTTTGIVITVSDGSLMASLLSFNLTVTNVNDAPTVTGTPTTTVAEDTTYSFTPSGGDVDVGTTLTYSINTQPSWANFDTATGTLRGTPDNGDVGTTTGIMITVSDGTESTDLATFSITVTNTNDAPTISGTPTTTVAEDTAYSFTPIGADVDASDTLVYSITSQPSWANFDTATGTLSGTPDNGDVGTTNGIVIAVSDGTASTDLAIFSITVTNTNDRPTITGTPTTTVAEDTAYSFTPIGADVDVGTTLTYSINTQPSWANFDTATGTLSGTPTNADVGTTNGIVITVSDGTASTDLATFSITVTNTNDRPTITGTPTTTVAEDTAYSFTPIGADVDVGTTLTYSINTQPSWVIFDTATGTLSGTPDNGDVGTTTGIVITVSDGSLMASLLSFDLTVTNTNDRPTITGTPTTTVAEDTAYSFTPSGGDVDVGTTLTYSINTQPSWANFDTATGTLSGTPDNGDVGTTTGIVITVSDGTASTDLATFSITVTNTNDRPTITGTPTTSIAEDTAYSFTPSGGDVDVGTTLTYSINTQPSWANFDTATGTLSGTPDNGDVGTTTGIVITVSDGTASTDLATFSITVTNTNDAPTITGTPTTTVAEDTAYSFTPSGGDMDVGTTLTYSINTQPSWANFDTATGTLSGTPDNGDVGTTTGIMITVSDGTASTDLATFSITVTNTNDAPTISGTPTTTVAEDTAYSFTSIGADVDASDTLIYSITSQPSWANFDTATGTLSGTPDNGDVGTTTGIVITVSDGTASTDLATFSITVTNTNDAPTITGTPTTTVAEDTAYSFTPSGGDVDVGTTLTYSINTQPSWANFDTATGTLSGTPTNTDVGTTTGIVITVSDGTASTDLATFSITVTNTNDAPTISGTPTTTVAEDTAYSFTPSGGDVDAGTTLTYSINTQPSWANFDTATGTLSGTPDNGDVGTTTGIVITVSDGSLMASLLSFDLTVTNVNDAPTITGTPTTTVAEDTAYSFTPSGGDMDVGTTLTYSINTQPSWASFDTATGTLSGMPDNGDVGTTTGIVITVSDGTASTDLTTFSITVTNTNDAPTISGTPTTTVAEDTAYSFTPSGTDVDVGTTLTYSINTQPSWAIFNTATGTLSGTPTNADVGTTSGIVITVSDGTASTDLATFSITVTNTNDAPTISGTPTTTVAEDTAYSFTPSGGDVDVGTTLTYSINTQPSWAIFNTATGTLSGTPTNADVGTTSGIVITVSDGTASTDLATFSITVTNTNDRPTITGTPTTTVAEDTAYSFTPIGADVDVGTTLTYSINTQPSWANFDTATGTLSGTPDNGDVGTTSGIVITVSDGSLMTSLLSFDLEVTNVNDRPTITGTPTTSIAEDTAYSFTPSGGDVDVGTTLTYSINTQPSWANFDTATGTLSGTPDNGDVGTTTGIVITVSDGSLMASLLSFDLEVTNVNDAPTITGTPTTSVAEDTTYSFTPSGGDVDVGTTLTYSINTQPSWAVFDTATGTLSGTPDNGDVGTTTGIVITVSDGTASTDLATFSITVTNTNDAPTITGTPTTTVAEDTAYSFTPSGGDMDVGTTLTYSINTQPSWANFDTTTGTLSGTPDNGDVGITTGIVITVSDGTASTDLATFSITVTNTNDAPTISGTPTTTVAEDTAYSFTPSGGDVDVGTTLAYSINTQPSWAVFDTATGTLSGTPDNGDVGTTTGIVITVSDGTASTDLATFSITVTNANDRPTITGTPTTTVAEDTAYSFTPIGADVDVGTTLTYSINTQPSWVIFDTATGTLSGTSTNADVGTTNGIVITVSDGTASTDLATFSITVTNTNDRPTITGTPTTTVAEDTAYSFTPIGADVDVGTTLTYSINTQPSWVIFDTATGTLSGTPTNADVGTTTGIVITASDGSLMASLPSFDLEVTNVNDAPTITGTPTTSIAEDTAYSFTPIGADVDVGTTLTYSINTQPSWAIFDTATGTLSGTPTNADVGTTNGIVITVSDGTASTDLATFSITVTNVNDDPVGAITIDGTPTQGGILTTNTAGISDADGLTGVTFGYQWQAGGTAISGETSSTFTLTDAQVGQTITVTVRYNDNGGTDESVTSDATSAVTNANDAPVGLPTITGTVTQGQVLTANTAGISDVDGLGTFSYQWQAGGTDISGETSLTLTLTDAQVGQTITVIVRYTDVRGTDESVTSVATSAVTNANDDPVGLPTITGTPTQGGILTANTAGISDIDGLGTFSYQWQAGGTDISGETSLTLTLTDAQVGQTITVIVRYTDVRGTDESVTSVATSAVTNANDDPVGLPTITGTPTQGGILTADASGISDVDGLGTFSYQWQADGTDISGETSLTLTLTDAQVGQIITVIVRYTDVRGTDESVTSVATSAVTNANDDPVGLPTITGTPTQGGILTANTAGISDIDGLGTFSYQWQADGTDISDETSLTLTLTDAQVGQTITVIVRYTDNGGTDESVTSDATDVVVSPNAEKEQAKQLNQDILPYLAQAMVASTVTVIGGRIDTTFSEAPQVASYQLDGQTVWLDGQTRLTTSLQDALMEKLPAYVQLFNNKEDGKMDWKQMLGNSSFVMPLNVDGSGGLGTDLTVWGSGDYTKLGRTGWKGDVFSAQLGTDHRLRDDLLVGGLLSWSKVDVDYTTINGRDGEYKHRITSIHPYLAWSGDGIQLWGSTGYGKGKLEIEESSVKNNSDTQLWSLAGGAKGQLSAGVNLKSDITLTQIRIDESGNKKIAADKLSSQRLRLLLEIEWEHRLKAGTLFKPLLEIGVRYDGGDGDKGFGMVFNTGLRYADTTGLIVEGKLHTLIGRENYTEWGIQGMIRKKATANGQGMSFSLSPSYGNTDSSADKIWQQKQPEGNGNNDPDNRLRINTRLGYGIPALGDNGLLTPYGEATFGESNRYLFGINWKRHSRFGINLSSERADDAKNYTLSANWKRPRYEMTLSAGRKEDDSGTIKHHILLESRTGF